MVQRRGLRLEVDEPSDRQLRNKRWLAHHPLVITVVGAAIFGALGLVVANMADFRPVVGGVLAAAYGALLGWAFSLEHRDSTPRGLTRFLYGFSVLVGVAGLIALQVTT